MNQTSVSDHTMRLRVDASEESIPVRCTACDVVHPLDSECPAPIIDQAVGLTGEVDADALAALAIKKAFNSAVCAGANAASQRDNNEKTATFGDAA